MAPSIARDGYPILGCAAAAALLLYGLSLVLPGSMSTGLKAVATLTGLFFLFSLYFFRDPQRRTTTDPAAVVCPADGTIVDITRVEEPRYLKAPCRRISIFMSVFNVHVNRAPADAVIEHLHYNPGKFMSAFKEKASLDNEQLFAGLRLQGREEKIGVCFIAGLIARRIVFYKKLDDAVRQGERINLIRYGSRVDVYCPLSATVTVEKGERVKAGVNVIARFQE